MRGLAGLVVLGNAWESVDVFHALDVALQHDSVGYQQNYVGGRNALAYLAWLRCRELIDAGKGSMLVGAPRGEALKAMLPGPSFVEPETPLGPEFAALRAEADAWHAARTTFLIERLKAGRHPDTDPHFWDGYTEPPAPALRSRSVPEAAPSPEKDLPPGLRWGFVPEAAPSRGRAAAMTILLAVFGVPALLLALVVGRSVRARRREARKAEGGRAEFLGGYRFTLLEP